jgi:hypothetical protein
MATLPGISIVIPTLNEEAEIGIALEHCSAGSDNEIIIVDGGSSDKTPEIARAYGAKVLLSAKGRARQMNAGARAARGEVLLFLHADTRLPQGFEGHVYKTVFQPGVSAGAFLLNLAPPLPGLKLIQSLANWRSRVLQMPYGDQAIFLKKRLFWDLGGFSETPIMEDLDLIRRLRCRGRIAVLPVPATSSSRRWKEGGVWKTTLKNLALLTGYFLGLAPTRLAKWYHNARKELP